MTSVVFSADLIQADIDTGQDFYENTQIDALLESALQQFLNRIFWN
jgi:hypothetical protein